MQTRQFLLGVRLDDLPCAASEREDELTVKATAVQSPLINQSSISPGVDPLLAALKRETEPEDPDWDPGNIYGSSPPRRLRPPRLVAFETETHETAPVQSAGPNRIPLRPLRLPPKVVTAPSIAEQQTPVGRQEASGGALNGTKRKLVPVEVPYDWDGSIPSEVDIHHVLADAKALLALNETPIGARRQMSRCDQPKPTLDDNDDDSDRRMVKQYISLIENWNLIAKKLPETFSTVEELLPLGKAVTYLRWVIHTWVDVKGPEPLHEPPPTPQARAGRTQREMFWQEMFDSIFVYGFVQADLLKELSAHDGAAP